MRNAPPRNDDVQSLHDAAPAEHTYSSRRGILSAIGMVATATLAGCSGADEAVDSAQGADDSPTADNSPAADDSGDADDSMQDDDAADPAESNGDSDPPAFAQVVTFANAYEFVVEPADEAAQLIGRFDGEHLYWRMEDDSDLVEMYFIESDIYVVENEQECMLLSSDHDMPVAESIDPEMTDPEIQGGADVPMTHIGTDQIDGDTVHVYEHEDDAGRMYVHADSGLPRRYMASDAVVDWFYDEIAPVEPPELDCQGLPDF